MEDINTTKGTPDQQAYDEETVRKLSGRFSPNASNIRLFKDNPYILTLTDAERQEANKTLLTPHNGEMFYDDEHFKWHCKYEKNAMGTYEYKYYSHEYETSKLYNDLKARGIFNQLLSAYNNGRIYNFYVDPYTKTVFPNSALVFPDNYASYTVREIGKAKDEKPVYVVGLVEDGDIKEHEVAMRRMYDAGSDYNYTRMGVGKTFASHIEGDYIDCNVMQPGHFYMVDFKDEMGYVIDTKLFQAVEATVENNAVPSQAIVRLEVQVIRAGIQLRGIDGVYPLTAGEDVTSDISFIVKAVYNNGDVKIVTGEAATGHLVIDGLDRVNTNAGVGEQFDVKFTYFPHVDENNEGIGASKSATVTFQIIAASYTTLHRVIPVMWRETNTMSIGLAAKQHKFYLKVYCLNIDGVVENRTKAFYDTFKQLVAVNGRTQMVDCPLNYLYDHTKQAVLFLLDDTDSDAVFQFNLFSAGMSYSLRFMCKFTNMDAASPYIRVVDAREYGYDVNTGLLRTLGDSIKNCAEYDPTVGGTYTNGSLTLSCDNGNTPFCSQYKRAKDGITMKPNRMVGYLCSDDTFQQYTDITPLNSEDVRKTVYVKSNQLATLTAMNNGDWMLFKFLDPNGVVTDIDVYRIAIR